MSRSIALSLDDLTAEVRTVLAETLRVPVQEVGLDADLEQGLGLDSLKLIELNVALEGRFGVPILDFTSPQESRIRTVRDLVAFVRPRLDTRAPR